MSSQALGHICRNLHGFSLLYVNTEEDRERSGMAEEEGCSGQITCFSALDIKGKSLVGFVCFLVLKREPCRPDRSRWRLTRKRTDKSISLVRSWGGPS